MNSDDHDPAGRGVQIRRETSGGRPGFEGQVGQDILHPWCVDQFGAKDRALPGVIQSTKRRLADTTVDDGAPARA